MNYNMNDLKNKIAMLKDEEKGRHSVIITLAATTFDKAYRAFDITGCGDIPEYGEHFRIAWYTGKMAGVYVDKATATTWCVMELDDISLKYEKEFVK